MENKDMTYFTTDGMIAMIERTIHRLWIVIIVLIIALVATNTAWIIYENSFEEVTVTQENADGYNNYIGADGEIINGKADN